MPRSIPSQADARCNATELRKASRRLTQLYDDALAPSGLRSTQFAILYELARRARKPPTLQELAETLVMDRSALGHTLRPLERDRLVRLEPGANDRRQRYIVLTAKGRTKMQTAESLWERTQRQFETTVGKTKAADLRDLLAGIAAIETL
jgi:DNA-binding MarR family transcriptional regulator